MPSENVDGAVICSLSRGRGLGRGLSLRFSGSVCLRTAVCTLSPTLPRRGGSRIADGVKVV